MTEKPTSYNSDEIKRKGGVSSPGFKFLRRRSMSKKTFRVVIGFVIILTLMVSFRIALSRVRKTEHHMDEATTLLLQGRFQESLENFDKVLAGNSWKKLAWTGKGLCLLNLGRYEEALTNYEKVLKRYPTYAQAWHGKAMSLEYLGRFDEAIKCYDKVIGISPDFKPAITQRERLLEKWKNSN